MGQNSPLKRLDGAFTRCMPGLSLGGSGTKLRKKSARIRVTSPRPSTSKRHSRMSTLSTHITPIAAGDGQRSVHFSAIASVNNHQSLEPDLVWQGFGLAPHAWGGFGEDTDMWMPSGDSLVFFEESVMRDPPTAYFRLEARTIGNSSIPFLSALLSAGKLDQQQQATPRYPGMGTLSPISQAKRRSLNLLPVMRTFSPLKLPGLDPPTSERSSWISQTDKRKTWTGHDNLWPESLYPEHESLELVQDDHVQVTHEVWFSVPGTGHSQESHRRKLAIRNMLAMICGKAVVGRDLFQILRDVHEMIFTFGARPERNSAMDATAFVSAYLQSRKLDDPRNDLSIALSLLAWSELPHVHWEQGYLESFVHAAGMLNQGRVALLEYRRLSQVTKHNLQNARSALHLIVLEVEEKLSGFDFSEMLKLQGAMHIPARKSFDAFIDLLRNFYVSEFGSWPPTKDGSNGRWLDRDTVRRIQEDFGALYDFLVDTSIFWDNHGTTHHRDWEMVCTDQERGFESDLLEVPVTDILLGWDNHHGLSHVPCPYPLLPENAREVKRKRSTLFSSLRKRETLVELEKQRLSVNIAYGSATNVFQAMSKEANNELLEAFQEHEREVELDHLTLQEARLGRWILLYGTVQVLSHLSVDVQGLEYTDDVQYFLCASLTGCPPWTSHGIQTGFEGASPLLSHCWTLLDRLDYSPGIAGYNSATRSQAPSSRRPTAQDDPTLYFEEEGTELPDQDEGSYSEEPRRLGFSRVSEDKIERLRPISSETAISRWTDATSDSGMHRSMSAVRLDESPGLGRSRPFQETVERVRPISTGTAMSGWTDMTTDSGGRASTSTRRSEEIQRTVPSRANLEVPQFHRPLSTGTTTSGWTDIATDSGGRASLSTVRSEEMQRTGAARANLEGPKRPRPISTGTATSGWTDVNTISSSRRPSMSTVWEGRSEESAARTEFGSYAAQGEHIGSSSDSAEEEGSGGRQ